jgi:hypothetical protein
MIGTRPEPTDGVERFRYWLQGLAEALETKDLAAVDRLFVLQATYQPAPFVETIRGRRAIREAFGTRIGEAEGLAIRAEVLGMGSTYGIAHWIFEWKGAGGSDGILLVAFDPLGRCTSLREWSLHRA